MTSLNTPIQTSAQFLLHKQITNIEFEVHVYEGASSLVSVIFELVHHGRMRLKCDSIGQSVTISMFESCLDYPIDMEEYGLVKIVENWNGLDGTGFNKLEVVAIADVKDDLNEINGFKMTLSNQIELAIFNLGDQLYCKRGFCGEAME